MKDFRGPLRRKQGSTNWTCSLDARHLQGSSAFLLISLIHSRTRQSGCDATGIWVGFQISSSLFLHSTGSLLRIILSGFLSEKEYGLCFGCRLMKSNTASWLTSGTPNRSEGLIYSQDFQKPLLWIACKPGREASPETAFQLISCEK